VYDAAGEVVANVDMYGSRTTMAYDLAGRQVSTLDPFGNRSTSVYNAAGQLTASIDAYGNRTTYVLDNAGRQIAVEDQYAHYTTTVLDAAGNTIAQVDAFGNRTSFIFDTYGRQVATEDQYGHYTTTVFDSYGRAQATVDIYGNATTTVYDSYGRVQASVDALGNRVTSIYDSYGRVQATQDSRGYATVVFDSYGRVQANVDQLGNRTTTVFDSYGRAQANIDALGNRTTNIFDTNGRQVATEDARGNYVTTVYDSLGRVQANVDQLGNRTTTVFDSYGRVQATEDARGNYVTTVYDTLGRTAATVDQLGDRTSFIFDSYGRQAAVEDGRGNFVTTVFDSYGRAAATEDGRGNYVTTVFDSQGRVAATENQLGNYTTTVYDSYGRASASVDPLGNRTTTVFDAYGRQVATIDPLGYRTTIVLDSFGRQVNEIDAKGNTTTFVLDSLNRVSQTIMPGGSTTVAYDGDGRLTSQSDPLGRRIAWGFDANGNNTSQTWYNADGSVAARLTFTYDNDNRQLTAANGVGTYTLAYDANGEVTSVQGLWGTLLTFSYDGAGHRTVVQDNFGGVTTNAYDANGNLTQQKFGGASQTPMRIDLGYDANNALASMTRYSDLGGANTVASTTITYDKAGELTNQLDKNGSGSSIANTTNVYDNGGRITSEQLNGAAPTTYAYDNASQLTGDGHVTPTYDATGNRTNSGYSTGTGNELQSDGVWSYSYDAAGNETYKVGPGGVTWVYGYDNKNELTSAKEYSADPRVYETGYTLLAEVDYKYDAWGNLVERNYPTGPGSGTDTRYAVDGWDLALAGTTGNTRFNVWADLDGNNSNALLTRYFHGDQRDQLFARQDALTAYWYLTDRQGSVRDVLDSSANVKDAISYDGWGNIVSETNSAYRGEYGWTGRLFDAETDLQYNRARWYDPATGRWMSQDPLGFDAGDSNLYRYVRNQFSSANDPAGMDFILVGGQPLQGPAGLLSSHLTLNYYQTNGKGDPPIGAALSAQDIKNWNVNAKRSSIELFSDSDWKAWTLQKCPVNFDPNRRLWRVNTVGIAYISLNSALPDKGVVAMSGPRVSVGLRWFAISFFGQAYRYAEPPGQKYSADPWGRDIMRWIDSYYDVDLPNDAKELPHLNNSNTFVRAALQFAGLPGKLPAGNYPGALMPTPRIDQPGMEYWVSPRARPFWAQLPANLWPRRP
jgi:RHS repeat-associated protein